MQCAGELAADENHLCPSGDRGLMQRLDQQAPQKRIAATKLTITISIVSSWNVVADQLRSFQQPLNHRRAARALGGKNNAE
jgi:hypothetical protein